MAARYKLKESELAQKLRTGEGLKDSDKGMRASRTVSSSGVEDCCNQSVRHELGR